MNGLIGKKLGMTQIFNADGHRVAVTVIEAGPCTVVQRKTTDADGYESVQLGFGDQKESRVAKPALGRFKKVNSGPKRILREFSIDSGASVSEGDSLSVTDVFENVSHVDITGLSKGRGFQGVVKRHRMAGGRMTHGGHSKRRVGAIGQCSYPARVAKGQRMPGHMGNRRVTTQNVKVLGVRGDENLLLVQGAVPGPNGGIVLIRKALKKAGQA
jgi:large subunit ribosomal protein L3